MENKTLETKCKKYETRLQTQSDPSNFVEGSEFEIRNYATRPIPRTIKQNEEDIFGGYSFEVNR